MSCDVKDYIGLKIGKLTIIEHFYKRHSNGKNYSFYRCICDCGKETIVSRNHLQKGHTKSCGCLKHKPCYTDITGKKYGKLTVLNYEYTKKNKAYFLCKCECGNEKVISSTDLTSEKTLSCGCLGRKNRIKATTKHGYRYTRLYRIWNGIKTRCFCSSSRNWKWYGARGISICDEWNDFTIFRDWALNNGYSDNLTIERIDVNGNYSPENCTWIPLREQAWNTRKNHLLTYKGEKKCIAEWCEKLNLSKTKVYKNLKNNLPEDVVIEGSKR